MNPLNHRLYYTHAVTSLIQSCLAQCNSLVLEWKLSPVRMKFTIQTRPPNSMVLFHEASAPNSNSAKFTVAQMWPIALACVALSIK